MPGMFYFTVIPMAIIGTIGVILAPIAAIMANNFADFFGNAWIILASTFLLMILIGLIGFGIAVWAGYSWPLPMTQNG